MSTPLIIDEPVAKALAKLKFKAHNNIKDVRDILKQCSTPEGKRKHMLQMTKQSVEVPIGFLVTFSVEVGHPAGKCLHMSMSSPVYGRVPTPEAIWMVAEKLGFKGDLSACSIWEEELMRGGPARQVAINVVQPIPT